MDSLKLTFTPSTPKKLRTVYIVDDNPIERTMMIDFLGRYPELKVNEFETGDECVKEIVLSGISPDIILLDYFLDSEIAHSKDGLEILAKIKEISPNTSTIMYTSVENQRIIDLARKKGAFDYIVKGASGFEKLESIIEKSFVLVPEK